MMPLLRGPGVAAAQLAAFHSRKIDCVILVGETVDFPHDFIDNPPLRRIWLMRFETASRLVALLLIAGGMTLLAACGKISAPPPAPKKQDSSGPRFIISADEQTVTDTRTRLVWKRCVEGRRYLMKACLGDTRLVEPASLEHFMTQEAIPSGWRLPTSDELGTIIEARYPPPENKLEFHYDADVFPPPLIEEGLYYWLGDSSGAASGAVTGWYTFEGALLGHGFSGSAPAHVRLVRRAN